MSSKQSTLVNEAHFRYIAEHTRTDDAFLLSLKEAAEQAGIPPIHIAQEQASFMQLLLKLGRAREVLEVGTLAGYSAIAMARALPEDGRVHTVEVEPRHADFAEEWVRRSDVSHKVVIHRGRGSEVLPRFERGSMDAAFLDADKLSYATDLDACLRIVRRGGLIMADNAFAYGHLFDLPPVDPDIEALRAFNDRMAREADLHGVIVPLGDGLWVAVRR